MDSTIETLGPVRSPPKQIAIVLSLLTVPLWNVELPRHAPDSQYTLWPLDVRTETRVPYFQSLQLEVSLVAKDVGSCSYGANLKEKQATVVVNWHFAVNNQPEVALDFLDSFP